MTMEFTTDTTLPDAVAGEPYGIHLNVSGAVGEVLYTSNGMPPGLYLTSDGWIQGTSVFVGTWGGFAVAAFDSQVRGGNNTPANQTVTAVFFLTSN